MLLILDMNIIRPELVISRGKIAVEEGRLLAPLRRHRFAPFCYQTVKLEGGVTAEDFRIADPESRSRPDVRVVEMVTDLVTREKICQVAAEAGAVSADPALGQSCIEFVRFISARLFPAGALLAVEHRSTVPWSRRHGTRRCAAGAQF